MTGERESPERDVAAQSSALQLMHAPRIIAIYSFFFVDALHHSNYCLKTLPIFKFLTVCNASA
jgi:muconolactone delta-isomerase